MAVQNEQLQLIEQNLKKICQVVLEELLAVGRTDRNHYHAPHSSAVLTQGKIHIPENQMVYPKERTINLY